jgi:hypothetical protein
VLEIKMTDDEKGASAAPQTQSRRSFFTKAGLFVAGGIGGWLTKTGQEFVTERTAPALASTRLDADVVVPLGEDPIGGFAYVSSSRIDLTDQPAAFKSDADAARYLLTKGCVKVEPLFVTLTLSRPANTPATIRDVYPVKHIRTPANIAAVYGKEGGGGATDNVVLLCDLGQRNPIVVKGTIAETPDTFTDKPPAAFSMMTISIDPHSSQTITLTIYASLDSHLFTLGIDYIVEGRAQTIVVDNNGAPFAVSQYATVPSNHSYGFALEDGTPNFRTYG